MLGLILTALFATGAAFAWPRSDDRATEADTDDAPEHEGDVISVSQLARPGVDIDPTGETTLLGTQGDDIITNDEPLPDLEFLNARGGADLVILSASDATIGGGAGNDTLNISGEGNIVRGWAGNDEIALRDFEGGVAAGGAGNDVLEADMTGASEQSTTIAGGRGDDILDVDLLASGESQGNAAPVLVGGRGLDQFRLDVTVEGDLTEDVTIATINDFKPDRFDALLIDIVVDDPSAPFTADLQTIWGDNPNDRNLVLNFGDTGSAIIRLNGAAGRGVMMDDISINLIGPGEPT